MKIMLPLSLAVVGAALALFAAACGGDGAGSVPEGAVAVVDGTEISRAELDELIERSKKAYASQDQEFPRAGTPEYRNVQTQYVAYLVQREEFEQEAEKLGVKVTEKDVDKELNEFIKSRFQGKRAAFEKALKEQGFTVKAFRQTIRTSVLSQKLFDVVTKEVKVTDAEIQEYYTQNQSSYSTPESRDVRHILIAEKNGDTVDFASSKAKADGLYAQLRAGADFTALVKAHSDDPSAPQNNGKLTVSRGQTVPEFDKVAFELKQGVVSQPVKTTYGYHLIEALSPVRKAKTTPLKDVRASIRATLLQERRTEFMTEWVQDLQEEYEDKVSYAAGFEPPELPEETDTETETETVTE
jgi:parvulin-like peptidyl-prolyl isomerase